MTSRLGHPSNIGPYAAWRITGVDRSWPWIGMRRGDDARAAVDLTMRTTKEPTLGEHPSLSRVVAEGTVGAQRYWVREHVGGVDLALLIDRTKRQGAAIDVDMALWAVECVGEADAVATSGRTFAGLAHAAIRWDGQPFLLDENCAHVAEAVALEGALNPPTTRNKLLSLVYLLALCIDPRASLAETLRNATLPERVRRIALEAAIGKGPSELLGAISESRTVAPEQVRASWAGLAAQLAPDERRAHDELIDEIGMR